MFNLFLFCTFIAAAIVDSTSTSTTSANVVRRFKPLSSSSFDEGKPMRRISYLRATNNETEYHAEPTADGAAAASGGAASAAPAAVTVAAAAPAAAAASVGAGSAAGTGATPASTASTASASAAAAAVVAVAAAAAAAAAVVEPHKTKALVEEHPDPTYDVIGGTGAGHEFIETPNGLEDVRLSTHHGSRRASMSSDMRSR